MQLADLIKKVKNIEITTRKVVDEAMSGQYRSHFKGHGVQFSEHRVYLPGDDIRHIDWKVSARSKEPLIKKYEEERELTVLLVIDVSGSEVFGSSSKLKSEVAAEIAGILAFAATHTGDRVGVVFFGAEIEKVIPPKKGKKHVLRIIRDILDHQPKSRGTALSDALQAANRILKHTGVVFLISDFLSEPNYEIALKRLAARHDVVAIWLRDEREMMVPPVGTLLLEDPESGESCFVDTNSYVFKEWLAQFEKKFFSETSQILNRSRAEVLNIVTKEDYDRALVRFFNLRNRRRR